MVRHLAAAALFVLVALLPPAPALAQLQLKDVIHEVRGGVLAHDVTFWAAGNVERGVALNGEIASPRPSACSSAVSGRCWAAASPPTTAPA